MSTAPFLRFKSFAALLCVFASLCCPLSLRADDGPRCATLTILHTNDVHGHLFPFDFDDLGKTETDVGGVARRAALIRQLRSASSNPVLVMDAGDVFMRGPLDGLRGLADFDAMNAIPYDVMTLGNNELKAAPANQAREVLLDRIRQAKFAVVSANVLDKATGAGVAPPYKIFDLGGIKVGVFGLTTDSPASYNAAPETEGLEIRDPVATARAIVAELEQKSDFIVALTHIGYPQDLELAQAVPSIDVIIGGHSHTWLSDPTIVPHASGETIVCQDGKWGKTLGRLDLAIERTEGHRYKVTRYAGKLIMIDSSIKPAEDVERILAHYAKPYTRKTGSLKRAISLTEAPAWVAERMRRAAKAQVGVEPDAAIENGLHAGTVTALDVRKMFPFVNGVVRLWVKGAQLRDYVFQTETGVAGSKVMDGKLYVGPSPVKDDAFYTLATESYYAHHSPQLAGARYAELSVTTCDVIQLAIPTTE